MNGLRSPPRKRRRTKASTSAEEAPPKRLHLDLESEEVATSPAIFQEQTPEVNENPVEKLDAQHGHVTSPILPRKDHPSIEEPSVDSQRRGMAEQNPWMGNHTQLSHPVHQTDTSSAATNYAYVMANWADPGLHLRLQSLPVLENLVGMIQPSSI